MGPDKGIVLVLQGAGAALCPAVAAVEALRSGGKCVRLCTDSGNPDEYFGGAEEAGKTLEGVGCVLIASMPLYRMERLAWVDDSDPLVQIALFALCAGLSVYALLPGVDPRLYATQRSSCPPGVGCAIEERLSRVEALGIRFVSDAAALFAQADGRPRGRRIVTARDVESARKNGKPFAVIQGDIVTPLAADALAEYRKRERGKAYENRSGDRSGHSDA